MNIETPKPKRVYNRKPVVEPSINEPTVDDLHALSEYLKTKMALQSTPTPTVPVAEPKKTKAKAKTVPLDGEPVVKKPAGKWVDALKKYNEGKKYVIPKKGTPQYLEVKALMDSM